MKNKGITLISLVVSIVVLVMFTGIVIYITIDENSLFEQAKIAKEKWNNALDLEQEEIVDIIKKLEYMDIKIGPYEDEVPEGYIPLYTAEDLAAVASNVPRVIKGKEYSMAPNANYIVMRHIDLSGYNSNNGGWEPIANFCGIFDGNGCLIENLTIDRTGSNQALFGAIAGDLSNKKIENILLQKANIKGSSYSSGICSSITNTGETNFIIQNCRVGGKIEAQGPVSGIAASATKVDFSKCIVEAELFSESAPIAGIVFNSNNTNSIGEIKDCAVITDLVTSVSQAIGVTYNAGTIGTIENCTVIGEIKCTGGAPVCGIAYNSGGNVERILNCNVVGNLTSKTAPIAGICYAGNNVDKIKNCTVVGDLICDDTQQYRGNIGGILFASTVNNIEECKVVGDYVANGTVGGIICNGKATYIKKCTVEGDLTSKSSYAAGIVYDPTTTNVYTIEGCTVKGNLTSKATVASGVLYGGTGHVIKDCTVKGNITSEVALVYGISSASNSVQGCYVNGELNAKEQAFGITSSGIISNCFVKGKMTAENYIYGIAGGGTISNSGINAYLEATGPNGVVCGVFDGGTITNSFSIVTLSAKSMNGINHGGTKTNCYTLVASLLAEDEYTNFYAVSPSTQPTNTYSHARIINDEKNILAPTSSFANCTKVLRLANMKDKSAYEGFDFENVWAINSNKNGGYPYPKAIEQFVGDLEPMAIIESKDTDEDLIEISANGNISVRNRTTYYSNKDVFPVEELRIPETVNGITVTKIENSFLYRINKVKKVYIPKTVTAIGQNAFYQNDIESIIFEDIANSKLTTIDGWVFGYSKLKEITIPASVTSINNYAFQGCDGITITIEAGSTLTVPANNWGAINATIIRK